MKSPSLEVLKKLSGHGREQPAQCDPAQTGDLDKVTSNGPLQPRPLCDSVRWHNAERSE